MTIRSCIHHFSGVHAQEQRRMVEDPPVLPKEPLVLRSPGSTPSKAKSLQKSFFNRLGIAVLLGLSLLGTTSGCGIFNKPNNPTPIDPIKPNPGKDIKLTGTLYRIAPSPSLKAESWAVKNPETNELYLLKKSTASETQKMYGLFEQWAPKDEKSRVKVQVAGKLYTDPKHQPDGPVLMVETVNMVPVTPTLSIILDEDSL